MVPSEVNIMYCPKCGYPHGGGHILCVHCGAALQSDPPRPVTPEPKKGSHRVPLIILAVLSVIGIILFFALPGTAAPAADSETPWFSIHNGELYFDESLYTGGSEITVPNNVNGEAVLYLSDGCFSSCETITAVHLPDTLEYIGSRAFSDCTALRGIHIPDTVWYIGDRAFENCTALEAISIAGSMEEIGIGAFDNCSKLFYIFYTGSIDEWDLLYGEFINPYTGVYCEDGSFYQGGSPFE